MTTAIIHPLNSDELRRIKARLHRNCYAYNGVPERGTVQHETLGKVEVWFFDYNRFEADVRLFMAKQHAKAYDLPLDKAVAWLKTHPSAIPCDQIEIEQVES